MALSAPSPLGDQHRLDDFQCTAPELTRWLLERARPNQASGASRCFVVCDGQQDVVGYYALAAGSVSHAHAPGRIRRNMPEPIPVIVLGRLAVQDLAPQDSLAKTLIDPAYRARPQRAMVITVEGFDWNCPQHIPVRIDAEDVQRALDQRDARIAELEARLAQRAADPPASG